MKKIHFIVLSIFVFIFAIAYAGKTFYGASFYVKEIPAIMKACNTNEDCTIMETACCPCTSGGDPKTIKAINKIYAQSFKSSLQEKCTNENFVCPMSINCFSWNTPNKAICNNKECQAVIIHTGTSIPSYSPNLYIIDDYMKNCTSDNDCTIIDRAYCYTDITKEKITIDGSINKKYKDYYYKKYPNLYNEEYCNKNFPGGVKIGPQLPEPYPTETKSKCINNKCDSVRVRTSTTTKPTINWYKLSNYQNHQQDEWAKTCINSSSAIQASNKYIYCMNLYLNSKNIDFTNLVINDSNSSMYLKANNNFENNLKSIGFIGSLDPDTDVEKPWLNEIEVDLSKQGFFIKENRDNTKIAYRVIDTSIKPKCGDNVCNPLEQYLYELNLNTKCSPLAEKTINFYHCPTDCADSLDFTNALNLEDFNKLNIKCINSTKEESNIVVPTPQKPIEQMNTTEKNQFIVTLQTYLIQLLTELFNMLKNQ